MNLCDDSLELPFDYLMKTNPCCLPSDQNNCTQDVSAQSIENIYYMPLFPKILRLRSLGHSWLPVYCQLFK